MPKPCQFCSHAKADQIDRFISEGHSYQEFVTAFPDLAKAGASAWSRHHTQHMTATASAKEAEEFCAALSVKSLKKLNRSLLSCAKRAHQKGKTSDEITAYRQIAENQKEIRALEQSGSSSQDPPVINVIFRLPEEVELTRAKARAELEKLEPDNPRLEEQPSAGTPSAEFGIRSNAANNSTGPGTERSDLSVWAAMGKIV